MRPDLKAVGFLALALLASPGVSAQHSREPERERRSLSAVVYKSMSALDMHERKVLFASLTADMKAAIWKAHLENFLEAHPSLSSNERAIVAAGIVLLDAELFALPSSDPQWNERVRQPVEQLERAARLAFSPAVAKALLVDLGGAATRRAWGVAPSSCTTATASAGRRTKAS
jgi:hypothetical protein